MSRVSPRQQENLIGFETIEAHLQSLWHANQLPASLLLTGPKGVGKATLAFRLGRWILAQPLEPTPQQEGLYVPPQNPVFRRVASGGHLDLLTLEAFEEGEITVDRIRTVTRFLAQTPLEGGWRIVIIDGALNRNAANALLKVFEEPPKKSLIILTSLTRGQVLPTLRSRCQSIQMPRLSGQQTRQILQNNFPRLSEQEMANLLALAQGCPGQACTFYDNDGLALYTEFLQTFAKDSGENLSAAQLSFCEKYAGKRISEIAFTFIGYFMTHLVEEIIRSPTENTGSSLEKSIVDRLRSQQPRSLWANVWLKLEQLFSEEKRFHLDKAQVLIEAFHLISQKEKEYVL